VLGLLQARSFLRTDRPEIVHSHSFHANFIARILKIFIPSATILSTVHNVYEGGWLRMLAYRLTDRLSRMTTAVSTAAANRFVQCKAVPPTKCKVVTNGIDLAEFAPDAERRAALRERIHAGNNFIWLTAGRIAPAKDYPNLLRAFKIALAARSESRLWIAAETVGAEFERAKNLAEQYGLAEAIDWLGLRRDLPALLDAADGFVLASAWEGMPLVVGEAMAMEVPTVATDVGGVRELMGETGTMVPAKNPEALAEAMIQSVLCTAEERLAHGHSARERIACHFSMESKADEWEALYRGVLETES
jgi:glycosyltransferase involved in cell wall biosynthesis